MTPTTLATQLVRMNRTPGKTRRGWQCTLPAGWSAYLKTGPYVLVGGTGLAILTPGETCGAGKYPSATLDHQRSGSCRLRIRGVPYAREVFARLFDDSGEESFCASISLVQGVDRCYLCFGGADGRNSEEDRRERLGAEGQTAEGQGAEERTSVAQPTGNDGPPSDP